MLGYSSNTENSYATSGRARQTYDYLRSNQRITCYVYPNFVIANEALSLFVGKYILIFFTNKIIWKFFSLFFIVFVIQNHIVIFF